MKSRFSVDGPLLSVGPSAIRGFFAEGSRLDTEPSAKLGISMEGSLLRHGPSVISSLSVEGSNTDTRTVHDSGPKRGGFACGY